LEQEFRVVAGRSRTLRVQAVDDCGDPVTAGTAVASFSNGDPAVSLVSLKDGSWVGTWTPGKDVQDRVAVRVRVIQAGTSLAGTTEDLNGNIVPE
jgi:hypothetical protein